MRVTQHLPTLAADTSGSQPICCRDWRSGLPTVCPDRLKTSSSDMDDECWLRTAPPFPCRIRQQISCDSRNPPGKCWAAAFHWACWLFDLISETFLTASSTVDIFNAPVSNHK